jgi:hypothetical protein
LTVISERRERILTRLASGGSAVLDVQGLCDVCVDVTGVSGAGIMLMSDDVPRSFVCSTNPITARIEELQYALEEGPSLDAHNHGRPVLEPNLERPRHTRWPAFCEPAVDAGALAVFGFPLRVGAVRLGALHLHSDRPGSLKDEQHIDALIVANLAAQAILLLQANLPPERLAAELRGGADFQSEVSQAAGVAAVQLNVSVGQALIRMRVYAFGNGRSLADVARDVVARKLRFDDGNPLSTWLRES